MNLKLCLKVAGYLLLLLALSMLVPALVALGYDELQDMKGFAYSIGVTGATGFILSRLNPKSLKLRLKESIFLVVLCWVSYCIFGALPYYFCGIFSITDSIFETVSGFTTTGSSVLVYLEETSRSILFWRSQTQWMGGMGIVVLSLAIMPFLGSHGYNLYKAETSGLSADKLMPRLQTTAKILWFVYLFISAVFIILLKVAGMSWFDAICHTFTGISSGGFSTKAAGIAAFSSPTIDWLMLIMIFMSGINFFLHYRLLRYNDIRSLIFNREVITYCFIILAAAITIGVTLYFKAGYGSEKAIRLSLFHSINRITSAGFTHDNYIAWPQLGQAVLILLMFIGGCAGSTAGGPKVIRIIVLLRAAAIEIRRILHSLATIPMKIAKVPVKEEIISQVLGFFALYLLVQAVGTLLLTAMDVDMLTSFTAVAANLGCHGPGFGTVGPYDNYFLIPEPGKWVLIFCMLAGRLELYSFLVLFTVWFWRR